ncbi:MAG TPA: glycosyltransferase [Candidatus Limnocylindria bacterium]|nr:glycosyltransferase [Candidatus Limnocylindria bacterium]
MSRRPRLQVVVQRYGDGVSGGAEAHARELVRHLRPHLDIEVATTTALDYWTWAHELVPGEDEVDDVPVRRFRPASGRARDFRRYERAAFARDRSLDDERAFLRAQGPHCPDLLEHVRSRAREVDHTLFFTYIYEPTALGLPLAPDRAVLVPTAHDEPALSLSLYKPLFHAPRAIAFNTEEEKRLVHGRFRNSRVPHDVVGVGVDVPEDVDPTRFRDAHGIEGPYFLYVGRIVESKGMPDLFDAWARFQGTGTARATLVLIGNAEMPVPARDDVRHLGRLGDRDKFDAYAGAVALVMPSRLESLSIVTLEAWALGLPAIVSARSPVLSSMGRRAGAGLPYASHPEFAELCALLMERPDVARSLGRAGSAFVSRTYTWDLVVEKYLDLFAEVSARAA